MKNQVVSGLALTNTGGLAIKNFITNTYTPIFNSNLSYGTYEHAVAILAGRYYPQSYLPYLLAVSDIDPDINTWNNLIFTGHTDGYYDHDTKLFRSARAMGMESTTHVQDAYLRALSSTYESIRSMVKK